MHILLINPNRYRFPPVIPLAFEYLAGALERYGHAYTVLDLCFSEDPEDRIHEAVERCKPELAGITVRQIDTVLYRGNEFFLDQVREYVRILQGHGLGVVLGGSGFSIMPREVLDYTGAQWGVAGPGENALPELMDAVRQRRTMPRLLQGYGDAACLGFPRKKSVDYSPYLEAQGIVGFRTSSGCTERCFFCTEGGKPPVFRGPEDTAAEVAGLKAMGFRDFHLCDSEFNQNLEHCVEVCRALIRHTGGINWSLYMKPEPFSEELFDLLGASGAGSITLSLDAAFMEEDRRKRLRRFFKLAHKSGIKVAVDLSLGGPGETRVRDKECIDFLDTVEAATIGVNACYRIYPGTPLYDAVQGNGELLKHVKGYNAADGFLHPVFFTRLPETAVQELLRGRSKFRLEGTEMATNYQRIGSAHANRGQGSR
jgi:radical SAM superfamily enzyme YgiQ (UPF0313 family)